MIHTQNNVSFGHERKTSGKTSARRLFVHILVTMLFLANLLAIVVLFSINAQASYGISIQVDGESIKYMDTSTTPQSVVFSIEVHNPGTSEESINLTFSFYDSSKETKGWVVTPKERGVSGLGANEKRYITVTVEAPYNIQNASAGESAQLKVEGYVVEQPTLQDSDSFTARITQEYRVTVQIVGSNSKSVDQGGTVTYNLIVNNTGNGQDTVTLSAPGAPAGWNPAFSPDSDELSRGGSFTSTVTFYPPDPFKSSVYPVSIVATSEDPEGETDSTSTYTTVNPYYDLLLSVDDNYQEGLPGETVKYNFTVTNQGNTDDKVNREAILLEGLSWDVFIDKGNQNIPYQGTKTWIMTVVVPEDAKSWKRGKVNFRVNSSKNPSTEDVSTTITTVGKVYGVRVFIPGDYDDPDPGEDVSYLVEVTNTGNTNDTVTLTYSGEYTAVLKPNYISNLAPDIKIDVNLSISVPTDALEGPHYTIVTGSAGGGTSDTATATTDVQPYYDIGIQTLTGDSKSGDSGGEDIVFKLEVSNEGTGEDDIRLSLGGQKDWGVLSQEVVNVPAQDSAIVYVNVSIPSGELINTWFINVTAKSKNNASVVVELPLKVRVEQTYNVSISTGSDSNSIPAGGTTRYYIDVKNTGSGHDEYTVRTWAVGEAKTWASRSPAKFGLAAGETKNVTITVQVPEGVSPGEYTIQVNVTSDNSTTEKTVKAILLTYTQVTDRYEVLIAGAKEQTLEAPEDVNVTYTVEVHNFGTAPDSFQVILSGDRTGWADPSVDLISSVPGGDSYLLTVTVQIKDKNDPAMNDGVHSLLVEVESMEDPTVPPTTDYVWLNTTLTATRKIIMNPQQDIYDAEPGEIVNFTVNITNTGSEEDIFNFEDEGLKKGWGSILTPTLTLASGESTYIVYQVEIDEFATRDESPVDFFLLAKSQGANDEVIENITLTINIEQTYGVKIFTTQNEKTGDPGEEVVFVIEIKNKGNDRDEIILSHSGTELGEWELSIVPLDPEDSTFVNYTVKIKDDHDTSDILITLNASSDGDESGETYEIQPITVHVNPRYEINLGTNGPNQRNVRGGESVTFSLRIDNRGTDVDTYDLIAVGSQAFWVTINPSNPTNTTVIVGVQQSAYIDIMVSPPNGTDVLLYDIIINVTSQNDRDVSVEYTFYANVEATYDVFIYPDNPQDTVDAGDTASFTCFVDNDGNDADIYQFTVIGLPPGWDYAINPSSINVPAGGTGIIDIDVDTSKGSPAGVYTFDITATSLNDPSKSSTTELTIELRQVYKVEFTSSPSEKQADVGETVSYAINIKNDGNGPDTIELTLEGDDAQYGFLYYSPTENGQKIEISPSAGGTESFFFNVTPPSDYWETESDSIIRIEIKAKSLDDPEKKAADSLNVTTDVEHVYEFTVSASGTQSGVPGESKKFSITIYNKGTDPDGDTFNLLVKGFTAPPGGIESYWESANTNPFSVNPVEILEDGQQLVEVEIAIPTPSNITLVPPGDYEIEIEVKSQGNTEVLTTVNLTMTVTKLFAAEIVDITPDSAKVDVGAWTYYEIKVKNAGNDYDNISISVEDDTVIEGDQRFWTTLTYNNVNITHIELPSGGQAIIKFTIRVPGRDEIGYPNIDPSSVNFNITVQPSDPKDPNAEEDRQQITTQINPIYEFEVDPITTQVGIPGDQIDYGITITNTGTGSDTFRPKLIWGDVSWPEAQGSSQFSTTSVTLGAGESTTIILYFVIHEENDVALAGKYMNNVTIESDRTDDITVPFTVEVDEVYEFELSEPTSLDSAVNVGGSVSFQFRIKNTGNAENKFILDKIDTDTTDDGDGDQKSWASFALTSDPATPISSVTLGAEDIETILLTITIPAQEDDDFVELKNPLGMEVKVSSEKGTVTAQSFTTTTTVNAIYDILLSCTAPFNTKEAEPGDAIYFTLEIRNNGTKVDYFEVRVSNFDESVFPQFPSILTTPDVEVDSVYTTNADFQVTTDKTKAVAGLYDIEVTVTSYKDRSVSEIIILTVDVTPLAEVEIDPDTQSDRGEPGDVIVYDMNIRNKGNAQDTFTIELDGENKEWGNITDIDEYPIPGKQITLDAGSWQKILVRVTIPTTGETEANKPYAIIVRVESLNTEDAFAEAQVTTTVEDYVELELEYSGSGEPEKDYDPNKKSPKFSFRVTNNGNQDESAVKIIVKESDWEYTPTTIPTTLDPGGTTTFTIEFTVPSDADEDTYSMTVVLESNVDPSKNSNEVPIKITVIKPDLVIDEIIGLGDDDELKAEVGVQIQITAKVSNVGTSTAESVQVKLYEGITVRGTKTISSLSSGKYENVTFRWTVVAEQVELKVEATPIEESNRGNNDDTIFLDLRPDFSFVGEEVNLSKANPEPKDKITITAYIVNNGGDAEDISVTFLYAGKAIGSKSIDLDYGETGEAFIEWEVPDKEGQSLSIEVEVDHSDARDKEKSTKSVRVAGKELEGVGAVFSGAGLMGLGIGLILGAIIFLILGLALGRRGGGREPRGAAAGAPSFAAFEKEEGVGKKAPKGPAPPAAGPVPFEKTEEEQPPPSEEEKEAKPKEIARVRCPKCGKVTEVTSTQRPLQIPCECGTTLMLKK
ncbi:MAG: hypothetical protein JSW00_10845 [Thermoplasmata archaeon]|nr:MAG: hypothetical protein JSW00_10845 [Thermoplasmata archaeon]